MKIAAPGFSCTLSLMLLAGLSACGGGGNDDPAPAPNLPPQPPQITPAVLATNEDVALSAQVASTDPNSDPLTFTKNGDPLHGTVTVSATGAVVYTPTANYNGVDQFAVQVSDGRGGTASTTFTLTVNAVNDAPVFSVTTLTYVEDTQSSSGSTVSDADGDPFDVDVAQAPAHAIVTIAVQGSVQLNPEPDFSGSDSLTLTATDIHGAATTATISLNITPVNDAPVAHDDQVLVPAGVQQIDVRANDVDVDGDALSVSVVTAPVLGTATVVNNQISYTPQAGYSGPVSLVYRAADPAGTSSTATLRIVVGEFQDLLYIEGGSKTKLFHFDGFAATPLNPNADYQTFSFVFSADGRRAAYNERNSQSDVGSLFVHDLTQPVPATRTRLYTRTRFPNGDLLYSLNGDGSYLLFADPEDVPLHVITRLVRVVDRVTTNVVTDTSSNIFVNTGGLFNPVSDEFYFQVSRSVAPVPAQNSQTFNSLFAGTIATPPIVQIGADYPTNNGSGSGIGIRVTPNGQNVVHAAANHTTGVMSLLVNNRVANIETDLYRPFAAGEFPVPLEFDMNAAGSGVCFRVNNIGAPSSGGPGRIWIASPAAPGTATGVTPVADYNFDCRWASDGKTVAYLSAYGGGQPEVWVVDTTNPNVVTRLREPLASGESTEFFAVARTSMNAVVGINPAGGGATVFYRVNLDAPGTSTRIGSPGATGTGPQYRLADDGNWLAYLKDETAPPNGTPKRLHIMSTRVQDFDLAIGTGGVTSYGFRPLP